MWWYWPIPVVSWFEIRWVVRPWVARAGNWGIALEGLQTGDVVVVVVVEQMCAVEPVPLG